MWHDVFNELSQLPDQSGALKEFLDFMETHGLIQVRQLSVDTMRAFLQSSGFINSLKSFASNLQTNFSWDVIPIRFRSCPYVDDKYGRVAIVFETEHWKPTVTIGFLYDVKNHGVTFDKEEKGIDLLLRIETPPQNQKNLKPLMDVLADKRKNLGACKCFAPE